MSTAEQSSIKMENEAYKTLVKKLTTIAQLGRCKSVLGYDQMVFMPKTPEASAERGAQLSAIAGLIHQQKTDKTILELIDQALASVSPDEKDQIRLLELERKAFLEDECIPSELAAKSAELSATAQQTWGAARQANDFAMFQPKLEDCFATAKQIAECKRQGLGNQDKISLYTQMLDGFETGMSQERLDKLFEPIPPALRELITKVTESPHQPNLDILKCDIPLANQKEVAKKLVTAIGYNDAMGRIDEAAHPFTSSSSRSDVRITSRFKNGEWLEGVLATLHEGGHAIYEQNLGPLPLSIDSALSMGAHESQSLFWERHVGKSKAFCKYALPIMREGYGEPFANVTADELYRAMNHVRPSFIRVEADELTYPLHVILRYNMERDIVDGKLSVSEMPSRWNDVMKQFLGVDVPTDAQGCLQDVHWSVMAIGYFPTYLLGSMTAAQLAHYCAMDIPNMEQLIEQGEFTPLREWLTDKIHRHGKRYESLDHMLQAQLGEPLNPQYFIDYVTQKYSDLYQL